MSPTFSCCKNTFKDSFDAVWSCTTHFKYLLIMQVNQYINHKQCWQTLQQKPRERYIAAASCWLVWHKFSMINQWLSIAVTPGSKQVLIACWYKSVHISEYSSGILTIEHHINGNFWVGVTNIIFKCWPKILELCHLIL